MTIAAVWRIEATKVIGAVARMVRDVGLAEELAQDALVSALDHWPKYGIPDKPHRLEQRSLSPAQSLRTDPIDRRRRVGAVRIRAILIYLAKKSGRLIPGDRAGEAQVVRSCFAAMNSVETPLLSQMVLDWTADGGCGKHRDFLVGWVNRVLTNLERWFADRDFVATKDFTVADILMAHVLASVTKDEGLIAPYPGIASYRDRCLARPAWKRTIQTYCARVEAG